jgi:hypothetical protein
MKHEIQRNKLVTQSGRNRESPDLLILTSRMQKSLLQSTPKRSSPY